MKRVASVGLRAAAMTTMADVLIVNAMIAATMAPQRKAATRYRVGSASNRSSQMKVGMTMVRGTMAISNASSTACRPKAAWK